MQQAEQLKNKRVFKEAEQLYSRVHDIVSSFSPANGPMIDVINRKYSLLDSLKLYRKLEILYHSNRVAEAVELINTMKKNTDSRGDQSESIIERLEFTNVLMHMGNTTESSKIVKEVSKTYPISYRLKQCVHSIPRLYKCKPFC